MKLRRYCVTVTDNWTPMREFWTMRTARKFFNRHWQSAHLFIWWDGDWHQMT